MQKDFNGSDFDDEIVTIEVTSDRDLEDQPLSKYQWYVLSDIDGNEHSRGFIIYGNKTKVKRKVALFWIVAEIQMGGIKTSIVEDTEKGRNWLNAQRQYYLQRQYPKPAAPS